VRREVEGLDQEVQGEGCSQGSLAESQERMTPPPWEIVEGEDPVVAVAIHNGHDLRAEVAALMAISEDERLREEDPYTGLWATVAPTRLVVHRSRFEVDLNRPRDKAVYLKPEDAWGLQVWKREPPKALIDRSLAAYDAFYDELQRILSARAKRFGSFVVLDLHSYNHLRGGPEGPPAEPEGNPEVNAGTGTMNRERWASVVEEFMAAVSRSSSKSSL
jgi:N-formylglutamate amidohydrolase